MRRSPSRSGAEREPGRRRRCRASSGEPATNRVRPGRGRAARRHRSVRVPRPRARGDRLPHRLPDRAQRGRCRGRRPGRLRQGLAGAGPLPPGAPFRPWLLASSPTRRATGAAARAAARRSRCAPQDRLPRGTRLRPPRGRCRRRRAGTPARAAGGAARGAAADRLPSLPARPLGRGDGGRAGRPPRHRQVAPLPGARAAEGGRRLVPELETRLQRSPRDRLPADARARGRGRGAPRARGAPSRLARWSTAGGWCSRSPPSWQRSPPCSRPLPARGAPSSSSSGSRVPGVRVDELPPVTRWSRSPAWARRHAGRGPPTRRVPAARAGGRARAGASSSRLPEWSRSSTAATRRGSSSPSSTAPRRRSCRSSRPRERDRGGPRRRRPGLWLSGGRTSSRHGAGRQLRGGAADLAGNVLLWQRGERDAAARGRARA